MWYAKHHHKCLFTIFISLKRKQSVLSIKDKQSTILRLEKGEKGTNFSAEYGISKRHISDIHKNKETIMKFASILETSEGPCLTTWLKHAYLHRSIDGKFFFSSACLGLVSSANILQIADVPFELSSYCSSYSKQMKCLPFFKFTTKTTQPRPQVFSVNAALTCKNAAFLMSFPC